MESKVSKLLIGTYALKELQMKPFKSIKYKSLFNVAWCQQVFLHCSKSKITALHTPVLYTIQSFTHYTFTLTSAVLGFLWERFTNPILPFLDQCPVTNNYSETVLLKLSGHNSILILEWLVIFNFYFRMACYKNILFLFKTKMTGYKTLIH